ncbi:CRISPR-associated protein Cas4 [Enemella evansiae]|uniref:CRISPR-associated protein Cas4 n=1 Tax=Enemella evansiae TaxID=2016499 RepID=UPI001E4BD3FA|nr:Dna2/Cas4 domain-containing protein [Enemella evansiae]
MSGSPIPISLVAHHAFCPRRAWLEANGERTDIEQVAVGLREHRAVDRTEGDLQTERIRALEVSHLDLGLTGRVDELIVSDNGWQVREHKTTPVQRLPSVTAPMRIQVALQVACLVEMGWDVAGGEVYFRSHNLTVEVPLSEQAFEEANTRGGCDSSHRRAIDGAGSS